MKIGTDNNGDLWWITLANILNCTYKAQKPGDLKMKNEIDAVLESRAGYGSFPAKAAWLQGLKSSMRCTDSWDKLAPAEQEALDAIAVKMARVLYGKPVRDNWLDIAGYATLALETYHE